MQVKIAQYACEHGNKSAMEHFTCQLGTCIYTWKMKYLAVAMAIYYMHVYAFFCVEARGVTSFAGARARAHTVFP